MPLFVGHSDAARVVRQRIQQALRGKDAVLLVGAPGTGKRTVAKILHHFGAADGPSPDQVGSLPFMPFMGPIEQLSLEQQAKFGEEAEANHSRLIIGTRLDPDSPEGRARLSASLLCACSIRIDLPNLVERIEDLEALVLTLLHKLPTTRPVGTISDDALDCLRSHDWPGNVSELEQVIVKALACGASTQIELRDLPAELRIQATKYLTQRRPKHPFALALAERRAIERVMRLVRGNKRMAARLLQIGKSTLYRRLSEYGMRS